LNEHLSLLAWCGLLVATAALIFFVFPPAGATLRTHPDALAIGWAFATAVGISLYNTLDARGVRIAPSPFTFIVWLFLLDSLGITMAVAVRRRSVFAAMSRIPWRYGATAGALSILSFGAALYAFSLIETAKVSALRETSVVFAAVMGTRFLGEGFGVRRTMAAFILAAGLIIMQFGG
jgi:drug/metabolite transporter (DMT)-like permease